MTQASNRFEYHFLPLPNDPLFAGVEICYFRPNDTEFGIFVNDNGQKRAIVHQSYDNFVDELSSMTSWTTESLRKELAGIL